MNGLVSIASLDAGRFPVPPQSGPPTRKTSHTRNTIPEMGPAGSDRPLKSPQSQTLKLTGPFQRSVPRQRARCSVVSTIQGTGGCINSSEHHLKTNFPHSQKRPNPKGHTTCCRNDRRVLATTFFWTRSPWKAVLTMVPAAYIECNG